MRGNINPQQAIDLLGNNSNKIKDKRGNPYFLN
jgi:hypothetical protein